MNCEQANRVAARTGGEVISSRGRVRTAPYADRYGGDASYRAPAQCYAYDRNGVCIR